MDFSLVKKHPVAAGVIVLVGGVILYLLFRGNAASASGGDISGGAGQLAAVSAAQDATNAQYNAQIQVAQIGGQVAAAQTAAQLAAVQAQAQTAQNIVTTQTQGATDIAKINADSTTQQTQINADAKVQVAQTVINGQLSAVQSQIAATSAAQQRSFDIATKVITSASADKSRSSTGWAQILAALEGQGPAAIAANQPSNVANSAPNIISSIGSALSNFF